MSSQKKIYHKISNPGSVKKYPITIMTRIKYALIRLIAIKVFACNAFVVKPFSFRMGSMLQSTTEEVVVSTNAEALIEKARDIIDTKSGFYSDYDASVFSEEFVFRGPYIGPLNKKDYLTTMDAFEIYKAFPDINANAWGFSIDPKNPNRVWFMVRNTGTFNGGPLAPKSINFKPTGAKLEGCPETFSIIFDEEQKLKYLSVGYVADRFEGNTNGTGAAVGIFNVIGLPFPKPGPLLKFAQWFGTEIVGLGPLSYSTENIPAWWKDKNIASEGYL